MALNKNHEFEELDGVKCCIVERNIGQERAQFLRTLLEGNGYTVVTVTLAPKTPEAEGAEVPALYTLGVTDMTFNAVNAVFGRFLRTREGKVVTLAYWQQKDSEAEDIPYFDYGHPDQASSTLR